MEIELARQFIRENHRAVLATSRRDGMPHLSDDYRAAMEGDRRVLIRIRISRAGPDQSG